MEISGIWCADDFCGVTVPAEEAALAAAWAQVSGKWFCALHAPVEAFKASRAEQRVQLQRRANAVWAKEHLPETDYRAWDEFQRDLASFHRETGRLAHRELRILTPHAFMRSYKDLGRIDIKLATEAMEAAERTSREHQAERMREI